MANGLLPTINAPLLTYDDAATAGAAAVRDSSGNLLAKRHKAAQGVDNAGGETKGIVSKTVNFVADNTVCAYKCDPTSDDVTATLPAAASSAGLRFTFKKSVAANSLIIDGNSSETIDGATTLTATAQWASITIICDGSGWLVESMVGSWT